VGFAIFYVEIARDFTDRTQDLYDEFKRYFVQPWRREAPVHYKGMVYGVPRNASINYVFYLCQLVNVEVCAANTCCDGLPRKPHAMFSLARMRWHISSLVSRTVAIQNSTISIPGFDGNPPARTPAAIRQAAYELIDGMIGDLDADQLFQGWIGRYGPLPAISDTVDNKIKMTHGRISKPDADEEERAGGTIH
jgi:hypothetical protein